MTIKGLAGFVVHHRRLVIAAWLVAGVALAPLASRVQQDFEVGAKVKGSEAADVDSILATRFASPFAQYAVLVAARTPSPGSPAGRALLARITAAVDTVRGVGSTLSFLTAGDTVFLADSGTFVIVGLDANKEKLDAYIPRLRAATSPLGSELAATYPGATLRWTGNAAINFDIRAASGREARVSELRVLPLTLLLLVLAFGTVAASLLPILSAGIAVVAALGIAVLINFVWPLSILLQNITSMIGLGVGIDFALLTVSRYREARVAGMSVDEAAVDAGSHAGATISLSGIAVVIGFAALLFVPLNEMRSIGLGGLLVVGTSVLAALTFLPALLATLGDRVEAGRVIGMRRSAPFDDWWRAWGRRVVARPVLVLIISGAPLLALAWQGRRLNPGLPTGNWLPRGIESGLAVGDLERMKRGGVVNTIRVLVELPADATILTPRGWSAALAVTDAVGSDPAVARAAAITTALPAPIPGLVAKLPPRARQTLMSPDGRWIVIEAIPRTEADFAEITALVRRLRAPGVTEAAALPGTRVRVGGIPALNLDNQDLLRAKYVPIAQLVIGMTLLCLMVGFRSLLIPIKAVLLNMLSVAAAFGAVVLVFQDGHFIRWVGLDAPLAGVFPPIPLLAFCVVFGLSMDYEVFLVARVAEARRTMDERSAVVEGLARTGGVITSAAAIMIAVFAAFASGGFVFIKVLGFALAMAVLIDATLVRMAIGPALLVLAGRWNWWPGRPR